MCRWILHRRRPLRSFLLRLRRAGTARGGSTTAADGTLWVLGSGNNAARVNLNGTVGPSTTSFGSSRRIISTSVSSRSGDAAQPRVGGIGPVQELGGGEDGGGAEVR